MFSIRQLIRFLFLSNYKSGDINDYTLVRNVVTTVYCKYLLTPMVTKLFEMATEVMPSASAPVVSLDLVDPCRMTAATATAVCESCLKMEIFDSK